MVRPAPLFSLFYPARLYRAGYMTVQRHRVPLPVEAVMHIWPGTSQRLLSRGAAQQSVAHAQSFSDFAVVHGFHPLLCVEGQAHCTCTRL